MEERLRFRVGHLLVLLLIAVSIIIQALAAIFTEIDLNSS